MRTCKLQAVEIDIANRPYIEVLREGGKQQQYIDSEGKEQQWREYNRVENNSNAEACIVISQVHSSRL